jgi:hypothetical protein
MRSRFALVTALALLVVPMVAIPAFFVGWKLRFGQSDPFGIGVLVGLATPVLASTFVMRWGVPIRWLVAIALGAASGVVAAFVLSVAYLVGCDATSCGS